LTYAKHTLSLTVAAIALCTTIGILWGCETTIIKIPTTPVVVKDSVVASTGVCFTKEVLPIYQANCAVGGCHDSRTREDGYDLSGYSSITSRGILANNPNSSILYTITASNARGRMPPAPRTALTDAQRTIISKWISEGAKNTTCN
jgi:uncharacterized membrane protein